jgi:hypothetical protein
VSDLGLVSQAPIDLTNATVVYFIMRNVNAHDPAAPKVRAPALIDDAPNGLVTYAWAPGDTDDFGTFNVEFEINWDDGGVETVPNNSYQQIKIVEDLDA